MGAGAAGGGGGSEYDAKDGVKAADGAWPMMPRPASATGHVAGSGVGDPSYWDCAENPRFRLA